MEGRGHSRPRRWHALVIVDLGTQAPENRGMHKRIGLVVLLVFAFAAAPASTCTPTSVSIDLAADRHPISPLVYGVNFPDTSYLDTVHAPLGRWGGNSVTRYNYQIDVQNTAADYYFENIPGCWSADANWCANPPANPQEQSGANTFLAALGARGATALLTVPTIGFVAKAPPKYAHPFDCGCPKSAYPTQGSFDPYDPNCGDGTVPGSGAYIDCGSATRTSIAVDPTWAGQWATYLVGKFGPSNGKRIYALDNEPNLWSSTHHDIRKTKLTYDELWQRMRDNAVAILNADPTALIAGPAEWGWPNYFCSDADDISQGCSATSPDRAAHGGIELTAWLLQQAKAYEQANGRRILHVLDLHYYPQGGNPPAITRSLWDPTYTDPSWIDAQIELIPRMRNWVAQNYPGTKIGVSEFDFYHHDEAVGAVTYAEVLGIFGRESLDMATAWSPPASTDRSFAAYRLFRNYDGAGSAFQSTSVRATASETQLQSYASVGPSGLTVVLVNESASSRTLTVGVGAFQPSGAGKLYANDGGATLIHKPDVTVAGGVATVPLAATTIAILAIPGTDPNGP